MLMIGAIMNVLDGATSHLLRLTPINQNDTLIDTIQTHENISEDLSYLNYFEEINEITWSLILMTILYSVLLISGVLGNICTCVVIYRNRYMHTATNYYLFSLAISDLLLLVMSLPQEVYDLWVPQPYPFGDEMCVVRGFTAETSTYASILTITAFTVERYIAICHPLKSHKWSSLSRALKVIMVVWIISLVCAIPVSFQFGVLYMRGPSGEQLWYTAVCTIKRKLLHAFLISSLIFFWLPQVIILVLYVKIGLRLRLPNPMAKAMVSDDSESVDGMRDGSVKMTQSRKISMINNRKGIIKMLVAVVVSFFVCWLPFHTQRLMADYVTDPTPLFDKVYTLIRHISGVSYYLSPTVNPILYQVMSLKFQQAFKDTFGPFSKCLRGEPHFSEMTPVTNAATEYTRTSMRIRKSAYGSSKTTTFNI